MTNRPQTIQIYLPGGDPRGIRMAEITARIPQVIEVPRSLLANYFKMPEASQVAIYFLVGQESEAEEVQVYVGQTGDSGTRFSKHNRDKDFWQRALVVISKTQSLTQAHAGFLEWWCIQQVKAAGRYALVNGNDASKPHVPAPLEADCHEIFDTARILLSTLGFPLFDAVSAQAEQSGNSETLYCKASDADGQGLFTAEGFVLLKGSSGRREPVPSFKTSPGQKVRERLIESGVFAVVGDRIVAQKDHLFTSPSTAAYTLMGRTANGWVDWKDAQGRTLDQLKRPK